LQTPHCQIVRRKNERRQHSTICAPKSNIRYGGQGLPSPPDVPKEAKKGLKLEFAKKTNEILKIALNTEQT
jgi:hypothetical protein